METDFETVNIGVMLKTMRLGESTPGLHMNRAEGGNQVLEK